MTTKSERYGKAILRWQASRNGGFAGTVIIDGKRGEVLADDNEARLLARLRNKAGKLDSNYLGLDEAIARFLEFMPGGLRGHRSVSQEREYKLAASRTLNSLLPLEAALEATEIDARAVRRAPIWLNILSPYESMHIKQVLENPEGAGFLRSAARFASSDYAAGAQGMENALRRYGRQSWPKATYFGYLWRPASNMFCKPAVTQDFARRIGHPFHHVYSSEISERVYRSLMDLAGQTLSATRTLGAEDYIDVQSFIYVVGGYTDADRPAEQE